MKKAILTVISLVLLVGLASGIALVPNFSYESFDNTLEVTEETNEEIEEETTEQETETEEEAPRKRYGSSNPGIDPAPETTDISVRTKIVGQLDVDIFIYDLAVEVRNEGSSTAEEIQIEVESLPIQGRMAYLNSNTLDSLEPGEVYVFQARIGVPLEQITAEKPTFNIKVIGDNFDREIVNAPVNVMLPAKTEVSLKNKVIGEQIDEETYLYRVAVEATNEGFVNAQNLVLNLETNQESYEVKYLKSNELEFLEKDKAYVFQAFVVVKAKPSLEPLRFIVNVSGANFDEENLEVQYQIPVIKDPIQPGSKDNIAEVPSDDLII